MLEGGPRQEQSGVRVCGDRRRADCDETMGSLAEQLVVFLLFLTFLAFVDADWLSAALALRKYCQLFR